MEHGHGESEQIVGKALAGGRRDDIILATKFHNAMGTDWIDLYQVHRIDPSTDIEETLSALSDLVHQGKVRYVGHSTFPASQIVEAQSVARDRHLQRFVTEQPPYSILVRAAEADVLPTCLRHGMAVMSYSPLTGGWLSGRWRKDTGQPASARPRRRWESIATARRRGRPMPPIDVFRVGALHFVIDGHHRVSVARAHGDTDIDAHVREVQTKVAVSDDLLLRDLLRTRHAREFDERVPLPPAARTRIELAEAWRYEQLSKHVESWSFRASQAEGRLLSRPAAAEAWFNEE